MDKIDVIIKNCLNNFIFESTNKNKIKTEKDKILGNAQKNVVDYLQKKYDDGDEEVHSLMNSMGYKRNMDLKTIRQKRSDYLKNYQLTDKINDEILEVCEILRKYTLKNGSILFSDLKKDYPDDYDEIIRIKNFIDLKGLTRLYDNNANEPSNSFGINWEKGGIEDLDLNVIDNKQLKNYRKENNYQTDEELKLKIKLDRLDRYMEMKFGINTKVPNINFTNGNKKIDDDTLIVNFTSALNCPAWNECLVKYACYARADEKLHPAIFQGNENKSLFWKITQNDSELLRLLLDFIKCYCFDFTLITRKLIEAKLIEGDVNAQARKISQLPLNHSFFTPEIIEVMKQNKRINYIRLNENGDFIGQWLIDAWENEATLYQQYDIKVSAYTCRNLNYKNIKNLILNTSFTSKNPNIARHFIALPEIYYDALDETYSGKGNNIILKNKNIIPKPQPLYDIIDNGENESKLVPNNKFYYKCPCDRKIKGVKINCYQCKLCYNENNLNNTLYVFVKAHGSSKKNLKGYDLIKNEIGVSLNFLKNIDNLKIIESNNKSKNSPIVKESVENNSLTINKLAQYGINCVVNNTINSINQHFTDINNSLNEAQVIKLNQNDLKKLIREHIIKNFRIAK